MVKPAVLFQKIGILKIYLNALKQPDTSLIIDKKIFQITLITGNKRWFNHGGST